jgi:hypothetical protein
MQSHLADGRPCVGQTLGMGLVNLNEQLHSPFLIVMLSSATANDQASQVF